MQCKDIPTLPILEFINRYGGIGCHRFFNLIDDKRCIGHAFPHNIPEKLAIAKLKGLIRKGLISGCTCGCRGDFDITNKGRSKLESINE